MKTLAADRGHGVCRVADADEASPIPSLQAVDFHGQQFHLVPAVDFMQPVAQEREDVYHGAAEIIEPGLLDLIGGAFPDDVNALPIVVSVEPNQPPPPFPPTSHPPPNPIPPP